MQGTTPGHDGQLNQPPLPPGVVDPRKLGNLMTLLLCGLVAGVVIAAAAFPAVGLSGLSAKAVSDSFQNLPAELRVPQIPQTTKIYDSAGNYVTSFYEENREYIKMADIPKIMQDAIVASEDGRFFDHRGVDLNGIVRALLANKQSGEITQGASTITQQYVKNILKYAAKTDEEREAAEAPTPARKIREIRYAVAVEQQLSKTEILERYLNIAFFGNRAYGIKTAAQSYFNKQPKDLTIAEAAMLAGLVQSPDFYDPSKGNGDKAKERRNYVIDRMVDLDMIPKDQADQAKNEGIVLNKTSEPSKCENAPDAPRYGFYCAYFLEWWKENPAFGKTRAEREDNLKRGGYRINLAYNPSVADSAQAAVDSQVSHNDRFMLGIVLVEPNTGRVLGMANNRTFSLQENPGGEKYPNTTIPLMTGTETSPGYQAGSTFKMFTAVAALERGYPLSTKKNSPYQYKSKYYGSPGDGASCSVGGGTWVYCPRNHGKSVAGNYTMWSGFGWSVNTYFIQLEEEVGVPAVADTAQKMGARIRGKEDQEFIQAARDNDRVGGPFTLGISQVTPLDMASAYATLAARGKYCEPLPLQAITKADGTPLPHANPQCKQVIPPDVADAATDMARCPIGQQSMTGGGKCGSQTTASSVNSAIGRPVAGKTGTTDSNASAWFVGYTPNLAAAVVKVNADRPSESMSGDQTQQPIRVFNDTMRSALANYETLDFVAPTQGRVTGVTERVPNVDGQDPEAAKQELESKGFRVRIDADRVDSAQPAGKVAYTSPAGGEQAPAESTVTIYVSTGKPPTQPSPGG